MYYPGHLRDRVLLLIKLHDPHALRLLPFRLPVMLHLKSLALSLLLAATSAQSYIIPFSPDCIKGVTFEGEPKGQFNST
jgi:hypothetical protein